MFIIIDFINAVQGFYDKITKNSMKEKDGRTFFEIVYYK